VETSYFQAGAIAEIAASTGEAGTVLAAVPTDAYALAFFPINDTGADFVNHTGHFVAGCEWIDQAGPKVVFREVIAEADSAGVNVDAHVACGRLGNFAFLDFEICAGPGDNSDLQFSALVFFLAMRWFSRNACIGCSAADRG
jgi:hypothetical protein